MTHGLKLPQKGFDTIFHNSMRGMFGNTIAKCTGLDAEELARRKRENDWRVVDVLSYMLGHAFGVMTSILLSLVCFQSMWIHGLLCALMTFVTIYNGSARYTYYMLNMYTKLVRTEVKLLDAGSSP